MRRISLVSRDERRRSRLVLAMVSAFLALVVFPSSSITTATVRDPNDDWSRMESFLGIFRSGNEDAKRKAVSQSFHAFIPLFFSESDRGEESVLKIVQSLQYLLRTEQDDWIRFNIMKGLNFSANKLIEPLFVEALRDSSPNARWVGVRWFARSADPEMLPDLEYVWRHEERPWVRVDLVRALSLQGSREHLDDYLALARGDDLDLALAAIRALATLKDPRAVPDLIALARKGRGEVRAAAVESLGSWPDEPDVLETALAATNMNDVSLQERAAGALASSARPAAIERLVDLAQPGMDQGVRLAALEALKTADPKRAIPILVDLVHEPIIEGRSYQLSQAIEMLMDIDDPSTLDALSDVDDSDESFPSWALQLLRQSLGRDRASAEKSVITSFACGSSAVITDRTNPKMRAIRPPAGLDTLRCWEYPGVTGVPKEFVRLKAGTPVRIEGHFELGGESWAGIELDSSHGCWVPLRYIESPATAQASQALNKEGTMIIRREFDLPASEVESDVAQGLMDAGLLEVIEPGDEVIGAAITIDPTDFDRLLLLARSCGLNETILDGEIYEIVADLAPLYRGHPVLDRFRRAPQVQGGETDEVIDLDIDELTDK